MALIKATTPTVRFTFSDIEVTSITEAILSVKQGSSTIIERDIETATVGDGYVEWKLTQSETLQLKEGSQAKIICDWLLADGTRGRSNIATANVESSGKNEVI